MLGSAWENGCCESFNGSLHIELLDGEIFYTLAEARVLIEALGSHATRSGLTHRLAGSLRPNTLPL